jgi:prolyl-tRNA synthetase
MRWSRYPINTVKETPAEAEVISHQLMLRAGLIRRLAAGIYTWTAARPARAAQGREDHPRGDGPRRRVRNADAGGAARRTVAGIGRWDQYGPELLRLKDRHDRNSSSARRTRK